MHVFVSLYLQGVYVCVVTVFGDSNEIAQQGALSHSITENTTSHPGWSVKLGKRQS